jgi:hypothetical protein
MKGLVLVLVLAGLFACGESKPPLVPDPDTQAGQADGGAPSAASAAPAGNPAP